MTRSGASGDRAGNHGRGDPTEPPPPGPCRPGSVVTWVTRGESCVSCWAEPEGRTTWEAVWMASGALEPARLRSGEDECPGSRLERQSGSDGEGSNVQSTVPRTCCSVRQVPGERLPWAAGCRWVNNPTWRGRYLNTIETQARAASSFPGCLSSRQVERWTELLARSQRAAGHGCGERRVGRWAVRPLTVVCARDLQARPSCRGWPTADWKAPMDGRQRVGARQAVRMARPLQQPKTG